MLVDTDLRPQQTIYYTAAIVVQAMRSLPTCRSDLATVFDAVASRHGEVSIDAVVLALDFLYLLGTVTLTPEGELTCT